MRLVLTASAVTATLILPAQALGMRIDPGTLTPADAAAVSAPIEARVAGSAFVIKSPAAPRPVLVLCMGKLEGDPPLCRPPLVLVKGLDGELPRLRHVPGGGTVRPTPPCPSSSRAG
jgi:hypothetical protein